MIPKKLHYIWLGKKLPKLEQKWMETSTKNNPLYEHCIWSDKDVDSCKFLEVALKEKKYAYASDYIRFFILYKHGGIYLDTDMELIKTIPEEWLKYSVVLPKETHYEFGGYFIGSSKANRFVKNILEQYLSFDGDTIDIEDWVIPNLLKKIAIKTFGEYSILMATDGTLLSHGNLYCAELDELCPYYPWDKNRINKKVDIESSIGVHYWNNYKKLNGLKLNSFNSKFFDNE